MTFQEESCVDHQEQQYLIYRRKKITVANLMALLLLRKSLVDCEFVECSESTKRKFAHARPSWTIISVLILQKVSCSFSHLWHKFGRFLEFILNLFSINGGFSGLLLNCLKGSVVEPKRGNANYRSITAYLDPRIDLNHNPPVLVGDDHSDNPPTAKLLDLYMMASKIAYENEMYIQNVVAQIWKLMKMHFERFFNCCKGTQAFILCDKAADASVIIVTFRGTELFSSTDWLTDFDLSWISMGTHGKAYAGFFTALGMQDERDFKQGWPKNCKQTEHCKKPIAYYAIRDTLKSLLAKHKDAQIVFTGHSLGGALASVFPSILILHEEKEILGRVRGVVTFGQPRVGDEAFANFMAEKMDGICGGSFRVVYRYDLVPRVPLDDPIFQFKHFGRCLYYSSWYNGEVMEEAANKNYLSPQHLVSMYTNAFVDLIRGLVAGETQGEDFRESRLSLFLRFVGLLLPGVASHSPRDYVNAVRLGKIRRSIDHKMAATKIA